MRNSPTAASLFPQAPEAWLVSEHTQRALPPAALSQIFGLAYFGDSLVAIGAGQLAGAVASKRGPVAPFELSTLFLAAGAAIVAATWGENFGGSAKKEAKEGEKEEGNSAGALVGEAIGEMKKDKKILLVGAVQVTRCHHYRRICLLPHHHRHHHQLTSCTSLHHRRSSRAQCTSSCCSGRRR